MRECESAGFNLRQKCETRASSRDGKKKDEQTTKRIGAKICFKHFSPLCIFRHPFPQLSTFPSAFCRCSVFVNF